MAASGPHRAVVFAGVLASGTLALVNFAEQPFARSLVSCDVPVDTTPGALFSGSAACGDRLHVIGQGQKLSGIAQALEQTSRLCMSLLLSSFSDIFGRRPVVLFGLACVTTSASLFVVASLVQPWSYVLFAVAQGLQGAHGVGVVFGIIYADIVRTMSGSESMAFFAWRDKLGVLCTFSFGAVGLSLQLLNITDFTLVWVVITAFAAGAFAAALLWLPETLPPRGGGGAAAAAGAAGRPRQLSLVAEELRGYWRLCRKSNFIVSSSVLAALAGAESGVFTVFFPWLMAYFDYTQSMTIMTLWPAVLLGGPALSLYAAATRRIGHRMALDLGQVLIVALHIFTLPFLLVARGGIPVVTFFKLYTAQLLSGHPTATDTVVARVVSQEDSAKFRGLCGVADITFGILSSFIYAVAFDAKAVTYLGRVRVVLISHVFLAVKLAAYILGPRGRLLEELDAIQAEEDAERAKAHKKSD